ncbi:MAG: hypothetical protein B7Z55_11485, partial [Planctomycetales bacterium 12-60-4]
EFFIDGSDDQVRQPVRPFRGDMELNDWRFSSDPVSPETLLTTYRNVSVFSRSSASSPASRWWRDSVDRHAYVTEQHLAELSSIELPPLTNLPDSRMWSRHPFDAFFSRPSEEYQIIGAEEIEGRRLMIAEVSVPLDRAGGPCLSYRAWLDLDRGAIPLKLYRWHFNTPPQALDLDRTEPREIATTPEIRELPDGGFFPTRTLLESMANDPDFPKPTPEELEEIRNGTRKVPRVVDRRKSWDCSLIERLPQLDSEFFSFSFPEGQQLYNYDTGKMVGALEFAPPTPVGARAPKLQIARWLGGRERTAEDLRGKVVVLHFWGLWCGACRSPGGIATLKRVQEQFKNQPVVFISIHTAEKDADALAVQIQKYIMDQGWEYLAAIDCGTMKDDSATCCAYGVDGIPTEIIIEVDGLVTHNSQLPPPGFEKIYAKKTEEFTAEDHQKNEDWEGNRFREAGETWPLPDSISEEEYREIRIRVGVHATARLIQEALSGSSAPTKGSVP